MVLPRPFSSSRLLVTLNFCYCYNESLAIASDILTQLLDVDSLGRGCAEACELASARQHRRSHHWSRGQNNK